MLANIGNELFGELTAGVELSEAPYNAGPHVLPAGLGSARGRRGGRFANRVEVKRVFERGNGFGDVAAELLETLLHRGGLLEGSGGGGGAGVG